MRNRIKIVVLFLIIIFCFLFIINKSRYNLGHFSYSENIEALYKPFELDIGQISKLLNEKEIIIDGKSYYKGERLKYLVMSYYDIDKNTAVYNVSITPTIRKPDELSTVANGVLMISKKARMYFQQYLPFMEIDRDIRAGTDINGDGKGEIVVKGSTGGNGFLDSFTEIYKVDGKYGFELTPIKFTNKERQSVVGILDVNLDGVYELIVGDNTWEISYCTDHSDGPLQNFIYSWNGKEYVESPSSFPEYVANKQIIERKENGDCATKKEFCFGPALQQYFAYKITGKEEEGWNNFIKLTEGLKNGMWPSKQCRDYVVKLHNEGKEITPPSKDDIKLKY